MGLSSDEDNDDGSATPPRNKKAKASKTAHRAQKFRSEWKHNTKLFGDNVSAWLDSDADKFKARCKWCHSSFTANTSTIEKHAKTTKHTGEEEKRKSNLSIATFATRVEEPNLKQKIAVKRAEIKLAGCFAAHNISMKFMDHLTPVLKSAFPDSDILKGVEMKRTKCTGVITNVIGSVHKDDLTETLRKVKFSVLTDESTHFNCKTAAVAVRFFDKTVGPHGRIVSKFWDLSDVFPKGNFEAARQGANSDRLFHLLMGAFEKRNIPDENFVGFASDGASVMLGANNSVMTRLQERFPGIIIMRCVCHSLHLAGKDASKCLPRALEDLARNTHNFFKHSSKKVAQFAEFQQYLEVSEHKMLLLSLTRWLCLRENVDRILEQWEPLRLYLTEARFEDNTHATELLFQWLHDPVMKAYYLFLSWVLPKISTMNAYFQQSKVVVTNLHDKMAENYRELLQSFMKPIYLSVDSSGRTEPQPAGHALSPCKPLPRVSEQLKDPRISPQQAEEFKKRCKDYMVTLCNGIRSRFNFGDPLLRALPLLTPKVATKFDARPYSNSIAPFADLVPRAKPADPHTLQQLDDQWRRLPLDPDIPRDVLEEELVDVFWARIGKLTDSDGALRYGVLAGFVLAVLSLPHSNADVERIFSKITIMRNKLRNRLITRTVEGLCLASECVKGSSNCCESFEPSKKMMDSMTATVIYGSKKQSSDADKERGDGQGIGAGAGNVASAEADNDDEDVDDLWNDDEPWFTT
ncbi:LOW QUALITY PROTEIN: Zinc finger protein 862 [Frankliniella fusca]|uniref:Zinc finger protein 862 n=1 Tax=Frankliniella fusca TaxID=407009 RepID=A0AAE1LKV2_9NEOP|nr:LOW QUALITY PROTEIN: Zinc finger protein 862 [Frankliniella fusca]